MIPFANPRRCTPGALVRRTATRLSPLACATVLGLLAAAPAHAQFGKNKVQYDDFDFKVLQTEHFDIHYYPEEEAAVMDAARMAERAYARLSKVFRHDWERRKPLILYASQSDFQQTNIFQFQISEGTAGITEMLLQSWGDTVFLLPALPKAWPDGRVQGLRVRGAAGVDLEWAGGQLRRARIASDRGGCYRIGYRGQVAGLELAPGEAAVLAWTGSRFARA